jgi:hypothetical protein
MNNYFYLNNSKNEFAENNLSQGDYSVCPKGKL